MTVPPSVLVDLTGEVACSGHEHLEKLYLDEVFNLNVDKVFENIFTDSPFFRVFVGSQKTFGESGEGIRGGRVWMGGG